LAVASRAASRRVVSASFGFTRSSTCGAGSRAAIAGAGVGSSATGARVAQPVVNPNGSAESASAVSPANARRDGASAQEMERFGCSVIAGLPSGDLRVFL
jgi:hypothetical protein